MLWSRNTFCLLSGIMFLSCCSQPVRPKPVSSKMQSCRNCGSTRQVNSDSGAVTILNKSVGYDTCAHDWELGISRTVEKLLLNGKIVLLRKGIAIGAFIPISQVRSPKEQITFKWYYRSDGLGTFGKSSKNKFQSGQTTDTSWVKFGTFLLMWSLREDGKGHLQYERLPGEPVDKTTTLICVTEETEIETIDALSSIWNYKGSPIE